MLEKIVFKDILAPITVIVLAFLLYLAIKMIIKKTFKMNIKNVDRKRQKTIMHLVLNILKIIIIAITLLILLDMQGIDTKSILASFGVFAAVLGLAFQDLIKDFISGISITLEGQYRIGDTVTINGFKGEVKSLSLKSTRLKAYTGEYFIIANSKIGEVINHTVERSLAIVDIPVAYETNIDKLEDVLNKLFERLNTEIENLEGPIEILGLNEFQSSGMVFRVTAETGPMKNFMIERKLKKEIKLELDKNNISIPFNQLVVHNAK